MYNTLAFIESPIQIMFVLIIALIVFGPKRLPELGKQLGTGLRELNKAKNDLMRSINTDHEPDPEPYKDSYNYPPANNDAYPNSNNSYDYSYNGYNGYNAPPDLTDYTIAGQAPKITAAEGAVARSAEADPASSADYSLAHHSPSTVESGSAPTKEGESHV